MKVEEAVSVDELRGQIIGEGDTLAHGRHQASGELHPVRREPPKVRIVATVASRDVRVGGELQVRVREHIDRRQTESKFWALPRDLGEPAKDVDPAIPPRRSAGRPDREVDTAAGIGQLFRELHAGLAGSDDEDRALGQHRLVSVVVRMELGDSRCDARSRRRDQRDVVAARGDDDPPRGDVAAIRPRSEWAILLRRESLDRGPERDRRVDDIRVAGDAFDDRIAAHEAVRVGAVVGPTRERGNPVWRDERERVPAVLPTSAEPVAPLEHEVLLAGGAQHP